MKQARGGEEDGADDDLSLYPELHQNEYLTTKAIYEEGFARVHGRRDAWTVNMFTSKQHGGD